MANSWCTTLKIETPSLEVVRHHREANMSSLLIVALLEHGEPMTLDEVAERFAAAGNADFASARRALGRCRPDKPPVYKVGDRYQLDLHDDDLDLLLFCLGLRGPHVAYVPPPKPVPAPIPAPEERLQLAELDEAWREADLASWSAQRLALAVLDANGGSLTPQQVVDAVNLRIDQHRLHAGDKYLGRKGSAIQVLDDGRWAIAPTGTHDLLSARVAVRKRLELVRRYADYRPDPEVTAAQEAARLEREAAEAAKLIALSRVLVVVFPRDKPQVVVLLDVKKRTMTTFLGERVVDVAQRLATYDVIAAVGVRALLPALDFDPGERRLAELRPPQKTRKLSNGRMLTLTTELIIRGSCGIKKPLGDEATMAAYVAAGDLSKLVKRLQTDVRSLYSLYEYGRLHGVVQLSYRGAEERLPVPWAYYDGTRLGDLARQALELGVQLEVVVVGALDLDDPWERAVRVWVKPGDHAWQYSLVTPYGDEVEKTQVQRARLGVVVH